MTRRTIVRALAIPLAMLCTGASLAVAAPLRVDVNGDTKGRKDVLTPNIDNWVVMDGPSASQTFGEVTVKLQARDGLKGMWWKMGLDTDATMTSDGVAAREIEMTISGLSPGKHSIVTFHSGTEETPPGQFDIVVSGKPLVKGATATNRVTDDWDSGHAYFEIDADAGKDVVLVFKPQRPNDAVILNGFEIDTVDPAKKAIKPFPKPSDEHAPEQTALKWTAAKGAKRHDVYLGANPAAVASADRSSPLFKGSQDATSFQTQGLNTFDNYYWRVDQVGADDSVTKGDVWRFRVRHLAFPGAEGYGRFALGGRGGRVYEVTTLEDGGPGSLREAIEAEGPRTVVFRVGGAIKLKDKLIIRNPYITVAGQTAPGDGIAVHNYTFGNLGTHDTIIRYIRLRIGDSANRTMDGTGFASADHCIMDHVSVAWSIDEGVSSRGAKNITFQRSIVAEPLNEANHAKYQPGKRHGFAGSISGEIGSFHHNLLANASGRNWSLAGGLTKGGKFAGYLDLRNNVVWNWDNRTNDGGVRRMNLVNNYYIPGPATKRFHLLVAKHEMKLKDDFQRYFVEGNIMEGRPQYDADNWKNGCTIGDSSEEMAAMRLNEPFCEPYVTTHSAKEAYESVMVDVGANYPKYDSVDERTIRDVKSRKPSTKGGKTGIPGLIDSQNDVGGYPEMKGGEAPVDSDHDGMPDDWEKANSLNPTDPSDGPKDNVGDGYTNLERYLNGIVAAKR